MNNNLNNEPSTPEKSSNIDSNLFSQLVDKTPQLQSTDKNKLFETFLMFQNFITLSNNSQPQPNHNYHNEDSNKTPLPQLTSPINNEQNNDDNNIVTEPLEKKELLFLSSEKNEEEHITPQKTNNYDEIPIKISNTNFLEMVEKKLANEKQYNTIGVVDSNLENDDNILINDGSPNHKRKIIKAQRNKKIINISKPSKNDKKYTYYTDFLEEKEKTKTKQQQVQNNIVVKHKKQELDKENKTEQITTHQQPQLKESDIPIVIKDNNNHINVEFNDDEPKENTLVTPNKIENSHTNNSLLHLQIKQLTNELNKYKEERQSIMEFKSEYEKLHSKLQEDIELLNIKTNEFETYKDTESKKLLKKEKAIADEIKLCNHIKLQNHTLSTNSKKDKELIESLRTQIKTIQNECKQKELNNKLIIDKLKKQNEELRKQLQLKTNDFQEISLKSKTENKFNIQTLEHEEEPQISQGIEDVQKPKQKLEVNRIKVRNHLTTNTTIYNNKAKKIKNHQSPFLSPVNKKESNIKVSKLTNKQTATSSSVNIHNARNSIDSNSHNNSKYIRQSKNKSNPQQQNSFSSTKRNYISSVKSNITHNRTATNIKTKQPLSSTMPKQKKNKMNNSMIMFSSNSSNKQNFSKTTKLPELKKQKIIATTSNENADSYDFKIPDEFTNKSNYNLIKSALTSEGKTINIYTNNKKEVIFPSGVKKEIYNDNHQIIYFTNGDLKQIYPDGKNVYYFKDAQTVQTSFEDGLQVFKFQGGQIEKHYPDGKKEITFPDGSIRYIMNDGYEETHYADGSLQKVDKEGNVIYELPNGTKEIKYADGKEEFVCQKEENEHE